MPFKENVVSLLDFVSDDAKEIGAVNCVKIEGQKLLGFNTDVFGFEESIKQISNVSFPKALILGTGGASKAVTYVLKKKKIDFM